AARTKKRLSDGMVRHPNGHGLEACGHFRWDGIRFWQDDGKRPRKEPLDQPIRRRRSGSDNLIDLLPRCHVDDERIIRRPSLRLEDEADRVGIESIRTQPVYRFRRKGYRLTTPQI